MIGPKLLDKAKPHYGQRQLQALSRAIAMATAAHTGQTRKSGEPYIVHPLGVASTLIDWGMDIDSVVAGVLHDTVEDTSMTLPDIEDAFGRDVAFLVDGVTKVGQARAHMRDIDSYLPETKDNLSKLLIAVGQDVRVIIIKLADRLHNMQTLEHMPPAKQHKIALETLEVFAPLADRINMGRVRVQLEELSFSYLQPREFKRLRKLMRDRLGKSHRKLATVRQTVDRKLTAEDITHTIDGRVKSVYSLYKKLHKVNDDIDQIYDLIALRIIVDSREDCYRVLGLLHSLYQPMVNRIKDYMARPKRNGYQSLHTTVVTPEGQIVEFQIRTQQMHDYAERGLAASFHYNQQKQTEAYQKRAIAAMPADLQWINRLQDVATQLKAGQKADVDALKLDLFGDKIFVHSPKGDIYELPDGSYPLDFAYRIHSDVGRRTVGFRINGKMVSFDHVLHDGDTIEVLTKRTALPHQEWLSMIRTGHARDKIRGQLKKLTLVSFGKGKKVR